MTKDWQTTVDRPVDALRSIMALVESPIEDLFLRSLLGVADSVTIHDGALELDTEGGFFRFMVIPQAGERVTGHPGRVDFWISCLHPLAKQPVHAAIECDGHDFHERTKEQARKDRGRDRHYQEYGVVILRFTGSEIHRDPDGVASEAIRIISEASARDFRAENAKLPPLPSEMRQA